MNLKIIAKSPIAHGAFTEGIGNGNIAEFRKIPVMFKGKKIDIPTISGNAVRGVIRRELAREFSPRTQMFLMFWIKRRKISYMLSSEMVEHWDLTSVQQ